MKKNIIIGIVLGISIVLLYIFIMPIFHEKNCKTRVFEDMKTGAEIAEKSVIGIIPKYEKEGYNSYQGFGSGAIFDKKDNKYYAITAAHVVENKEYSYLIFTKNTEFKGQTVSIDEKKSINFEIPDEEYYDSLLNGNIEYISSTDDLAIISFETEEDLPVLEFENNDIEKGSRIVCIGHPEGNKYYKSYGTVISDLKTVNIQSKTTNTIKTHRILEHNSYINFGNSGGVAISENMKIIGINIGGAFSLTHKFSKGFMIPYDIVKENINKWQTEK